MEDILVVGLNPWLGCAKTQTQRNHITRILHSVRMEKLSVILFTLFLYKTIGQSALSMHKIDEQPHLLCRLCVQ